MGKWRLYQESWSHACGYGPRAIQLSEDSESLFVGCKDGTILVVRGLACGDGEGWKEVLDRGTSVLGGRRKSGGAADGSLPVRAICDLGVDSPGWLLVGRDRGLLEVRRWDEGHAGGVIHDCSPLAGIPAAPDFGDAGPVTRADWFDPEHLVISFRRAGSFLLPWPGVTDSGLDRRALWAAAIPLGDNDSPTLGGLACAVPVRRAEGSDRPDRWVLVWTDGSYCVARRSPRSAYGVVLSERERLGVAGRDGEFAAFVSDFAFAKERPLGNRTGSWTTRREIARGVYVATDTGVHLLTLTGGTDTELHSRSVVLPRLDSMCMSITYYAHDPEERGADAAGGRQYLWVSDARGDAHLFEAPDTHRPPATSWQQSGIRQQRAQVMRAFLSWKQMGEMGEYLVVGQARRNDRVVVTRYRRIEARKQPPAGDAPERASAWDLMHSGTVEQLEARKLKRLQELGGWPAEEAEKQVQPGDPNRGWLPEALVADAIELMAEEDPDGLVDFLRTPSGGVAADALGTIARAPSIVADRVVGTIATWTHALLGAIRRRVRDPSESVYLGVIRWLRLLADDTDLRERLQAESRGDAFVAELAKAVAEQTVFARKWGLFGATYRTRTGAFAPVLSALNAHARAEEHRRSLDNLVYESWLFRTRLDRLLLHPTDPEVRRTAWDVQYLHPEGKGRMVAISWAQDTRLYDLLPGEDGTAAAHGVWRLEPRLIIAASDGPPSAEPDPARLELRDRTDSERYTRCLVLGELDVTGDGAEPVLLVAPRASVESPRGPEAVQLRRVEGIADTPATCEPASQTRSRPDRPVRQTWEDPVLGRATLDPGESVHSLVQLERGYWLAGLRGSDGRAVLELIRWGEGSLRRHPVPNDELTPGHPQGRTGDEGPAVGRNPVWCIAREAEAPAGAPDGPRDGGHVVVVGCGDGKVWRLVLPCARECRDLPDGAWFRDARTKRPSRPPTVQLVGQLGGAVWAVAYRVVADGEGKVVERVWAGASDGTLMAWHAEPPGDKGRVFVPLWATRESGPIVRIHMFRAPVVDAPTAGRASQEDHPITVGVTQQGRAVVVLDVPRAVRPSGTARHRLLVPGERLDRIRLGTTAFASQHLPGSAFDGPAWGGLLMATGDGRARLAAVRHVRRTRERHDQFEKIRDMWEKEVLRKGDDEDKVDCRLLRLAEGVGAATPPLAIVLCRWLLSRPALPDATSPDETLPDETLPDATPPGPEKATTLDEALTTNLNRYEVHRQWLPRHLRLLAGFEAAWGERELPAGVPDRRQHIATLVLRTLQRVRSVDDLDLYEDVVATLLRFGNEELRLRAIEDQAGTIAERFGGLLDGLDRSINHWLGVGDEANVKVRIVQAKELLDGETLYRLGQRYEEETRRGQTDGPFRRVLEARVDHVRKLLELGDPLLSLEVIYAVNLSMFRACRWLGERSPAPGEGEPAGGDALPPVGELPWDVIRPFFDALGELSARGAHSGHGLDDSLAQAISRAYALVICACPSHTVQIAHRMTEAKLPVAMLERTRGQLSLLGDLGVKIRDRRADVLFASAAGLGERRRTELDRALSPWNTEFAKLLVGKTGGADADEVAFALRPASRLGEDNEDRVKRWAAIEVWVRRLHRLAENLEGAARRVDLTLFLRFRDEMARQGQKNGEKAQHPYHHSISYWRRALAKLPKSLTEPEPPGADANVRPDVVLRSRELAQWCTEALDQVDRHVGRHTLFEPEAGIYRDVLTRLRDAARSFPLSAAVQKDLVRGVLGHGLLESLDHQILEFWEIAQTLDPIGVWAYQDGRSPKPGASSPQTAAARFADYMVRLARNAEAVPKNLRLLRDLLQHSLTQAGARARTKEFVDLFHDLQPEGPRRPERGANWRRKAGPLWLRDEPRDLAIERPVARFLRLALDELADNDRVHGLPIRDRCGSIEWPRARILDVNVHPFGVELEFRYPPRKQSRLAEVQERGLQDTQDPERASGVASHGTGLYLANLAAAVAGWQLKMDPPGEPSGRLVFHLVKVHEWADPAQDRQGDGP